MIAHAADFHRARRIDQIGQIDHRAAALGHILVAATGLARGSQHLQEAAGVSIQRHQAAFCVTETRESMAATGSKLSGVMALWGISISNSASIASIRLTMSSEVRPASRRLSPLPGIAATPRLSSMRQAMAVMRSLGDDMDGLLEAPNLAAHG